MHAWVSMAIYAHGHGKRVNLKKFFIYKFQKPRQTFSFPLYFSLLGFLFVSPLSSFDFSNLKWKLSTFALFFWDHVLNGNKVWKWSKLNVSEANEKEWKHA